MGDSPHQSNPRCSRKLVRKYLLEEGGPEGQKTCLGVQKYSFTVIFHNKSLWIKVCTALSLRFCFKY